MISFLAFLWWRLGEVLYAFGHASRGQLPFLAGWASGTFDPVRAVRGKHDFAPLPGTFSLVMIAITGIVALTAAVASADSAGRRRSGLLRQMLGDDLAMATLRLAAARKTEPSLTSQIPKATAMLEGMSEVVGRSVEAASRATEDLAASVHQMANVTAGFLERVAPLQETLVQRTAAEEWLERSVQLHDMLRQTLTAEAQVAARAAERQEALSRHMPKVRRICAPH